MELQDFNQLAKHEKEQIINETKEWLREKLEEKVTYGILGNDILTLFDRIWKRTKAGAGSGIFKAEIVAENVLKQLQKPLLQLGDKIVSLGESISEELIKVVILKMIYDKHSIVSSAASIAIDEIVNAFQYDNRAELIRTYHPFDKRSYKERRRDAYNAIIDLLPQFHPDVQVDLSRIANLAKTTKKDTEAILLEVLKVQPKLGEYLDLEQKFIRAADSDQILAELVTNPLASYSYFTCTHCGEPLATGKEETCLSCGKDILFCQICKRLVNFDQDVGKCSLCDIHAHYACLFEFVKTQGECPFCKKGIPSDGVILETEKIKK